MILLGSITVGFNCNPIPPYPNVDVPFYVCPEPAAFLVDGDMLFFPAAVVAVVVVLFPVIPPYLSLMFPVFYAKVAPPTVLFECDAPPPLPPFIFGDYPSTTPLLYPT